MARPKKAMFVQYEIVRTVRVTYNGVVIDNLNAASEWEGLIKLVTADGEELILEETDNLGNTNLMEKKLGQVIKGSQAMLARLTTPPVAVKEDAS